MVLLSFDLAGEYAHPRGVARGSRAASTGTDILEDDPQ
jgi:hypothetical protein